MSPVGEHWPPHIAGPDVDVTGSHEYRPVFPKVEGEEVVDLTVRRVPFEPLATHGHQCPKVLRAQGEDQVDVMVVDLPESEEKALNVALNAGAISGEFVQEDLDRLLEELKACEPELFDQLLLEELAGQALREALGASEGLTDEDTVPEPPEDPISVRGQVYQLGRHRLMCGDSGRPEEVDQLLAGERIQLVNTDPPCNVKVEPRSNNASPLMAQARCSASAGAPRGRGGNVAREWLRPPWPTEESVA